MITSNNQLINQSIVLTNYSYGFYSNLLVLSILCLLIYVMFYICLTRFFISSLPSSSCLFKKTNSIRSA
ncbi:hypothetical protein DERP_004801 [Dermatophagoides pteronyssinus]|uniref:Uncharacterized protein n=1 Tax=Dermatophagoides pteronyssinus TaxID=6956 RepID=A0ABQ8JSK2_DERPT|nr:hypothetical protein DERP_004801 [Dermatophagoides pteronyssinus]